MVCADLRLVLAPWCRDTADQTGPLRVDTEGSSYDTILSVYRGSCGALAFVGCDDDEAGTLQSAVSFDAVAGETYFFLVTGYNGIGGTLRLQLGAAPPTRTPTSTRTATRTPTRTRTPTATPRSVALLGTTTYRDSGNPIAGAIVRLTDRVTQQSLATTDALGAFAVIGSWRWTPTRSVIFPI